MRRNRLLCAALSLAMTCCSVPVMSLPAVAEIEEETVYDYNNLFQYRIEDGHIVVTGCAEDIVTLEIPEEIDGYPVTEIESKAFSEATNLVTAVLPDSLTVLGDRAFVLCSSLKSVQLPAGLTAILHNTFNGCTSLTSIRIPESVRSIGAGAFRNCTNLADIAFPPELDFIKANAFTDTAWLDSQPEGFVSIANVLYCYHGSMPERTELVLDESITVIAECALSGETNLSAVTFHDGITDIGWNAFRDTGIESVTLPAHCKLNSGVFEECKQLKTVTIPGSVKTIELSTFSGCSALESLTIGEGIEKIDSLAFVDCDALTSITVPASIQEIGGSAFGYRTMRDSGGFMISYLEPVEGFTVYGYKGTAAETYAEEFDLLFVARTDPPPVKLKGDINADGQCSFDDVVLLESYLLAVQTELPDWEAGDMDENGRLNAADLTLLKRQLLLQDPDAE